MSVAVRYVNLNDADKQYKVGIVKLAQKRERLDLVGLENISDDFFPTRPARKLKDG